MSKPSALAAFTLCLALAGASSAEPLGGIAEISIVDRDTGVALSPHFYRGEYWVAGRPGAKYAIEVHNRLGERLLAVTSVDGVNVLSGETAAFDQTGYVFTGGERYQITGWRKSDSEVAAFTFTDLSDSYAALTGRPSNVGVIGVALFRERRPPAIYSPPRRMSEAPRAAEPAGAQVPRSDSFESLTMGSARGLAAPSPAAPPTAAPSTAIPAERAAADTSRLLENKLGTGHGEREYSYVDHTAFTREQPQPNEIIHIRYDSLENLLALGIVKRVRPLPSTTNPFPASPPQQYVPDPPG
jgi:hypothetical protein